MFPHRLTDSRAYAIAEAMLDGFDRHYRLFSETNRAAKQRFEQADWHGQQRAQALRIEFYDKRVLEAVARRAERRPVIPAARRRILTACAAGPGAWLPCAGSRWRSGRWRWSRWAMPGSPFAPGNSPG